MKLPDKVFGIDTKKAYEKLLREKEEPAENDKQKILPAANIENKDYIILPSKKYPNYSYPDILVSIDKIHYGKTWHECHEELSKEQSFMLTIRQYVDFINLLKSGKAYNVAGKEISQHHLNLILEEILDLKNPWHAEWLDAKFSVKGGILNKSSKIVYHKINDNKIIELIKEELDPFTLMKDKTPGLSLDDWLKNANSHGLPTKNTANGDFYYWYPRNDAVAGFIAYADGAYLGCDRNPQDSDSVLGVRRAKIRS